MANGNFLKAFFILLTLVTIGGGILLGIELGNTYGKNKMAPRINEFEAEIFKVTGERYPNDEYWSTRSRNLYGELWDTLYFYRIIGGVLGGLSGLFLSVFVIRTLRKKD